MLAVMSSRMHHAEVQGWQPDHSNLCRGLRRLKSGFVACYLTDTKLAALGHGARCRGEPAPGGGRRSAVRAICRRRTSTEIARCPPTPRRVHGHSCWVVHPASWVRCCSLVSIMPPW